MVWEWKGVIKICKGSDDSVAKGVFTRLKCNCNGPQPLLCGTALRISKPVILPINTKVANNAKAKKKKGKKKPAPSFKRLLSFHDSGGSTPTERNQQYNLQVFNMVQIRQMTRNFRSDQMLGEGGFGTVHKGYLDEATAMNITTPSSSVKVLPVAVKVLNLEGLQGHREWLAEVTFLGQLRHPHLVKLVGYCCEDEERVLVYEYMPRGSLENHLFRKISVPLPWAARMKIAQGAAKGLAFLHGAENPVIYRDFKTSNILLDADYTAKLCDFGLAKDGPEGDETHVTTRVMGTYGYAAPEYVMTGHLNAKSDVYSFGVVLLELLTGKRALDKSRPPREQNLAEWARPYLHDKRKLYMMMDPRLCGHFSIKAAQKAASLVYSCLSQNAKSRPLMEEVVQILEPLEDMKDASISYHGSGRAKAKDSQVKRYNHHRQQHTGDRNSSIYSYRFRTSPSNVARQKNVKPSEAHNNM